jgi:hypothetical protein
MVERALYTTSWLAGFPEFVAIWLALKVAGQWDRWKQDVGTTLPAGASDPHSQDAARATYTGYLLGNALSISFALVGGFTSQRLIARQWGTATVVPLAFLIATGLLYLYIRRNVRADPDAPNQSRP